MKHYLLLSLAVALCFCTRAQRVDSTGSRQKPTFKLGVSYNYNLNYYGRTDSIKSNGIIPKAEIWFTKDFYVSASPVFISNELQAFDYAGSAATVGYMHVSKKWISSGYLLKYFYEPDAAIIQSALKAQAGSSFSYLNKLINVTAGADVKYSDRFDYGAMLGIDHILKKTMKNNGVLVLDPCAYVYSGTQKFTNTYYKKQNGFLFFPGSEELVTEQVQKFNVLAYEFSVPVVYAKKGWMFLLTPSYILPQNLVEVKDRPELNERGAAMFYGSASLRYSF